MSKDNNSNYMRLINWAKFFLASELRKVNVAESSFLISRPRLESMTFSEAKKIKQLKDPKKIYGMISVYADEKFNNKNSRYRMTDAQQDLIINMLFNSKGDTQFIEACKTFCTMGTGTFDVKDCVIESVTYSLTRSENDYQAKYAGRIARNLELRKHSCFAALVRTISDIEPLEKIRDTYDYIIRLIESDYSDELVSKYLIELIKRNIKSFEEAEIHFYDTDFNGCNLAIERAAIIDFIAGKPCYSHRIQKPKVKVKTLNHAYGVRPKIER